MDDVFSFKATHWSAIFGFSLKSIVFLLLATKKQKKNIIFVEKQISKYTEISHFALAH